VAWLPALFRQRRHSMPQHSERALRAPSHLAFLSRAGCRGACNPFRQDGTGWFSSHHPTLKFTNAIKHKKKTQLETHAPPVPLGTRSASGVTTNDLLLRSLDPLISPEGRVVWVPHFAVRYPLGKGHVRPYCQRTRW